MDDEKRQREAGRIERGEIISVDDGRYTIRSFERDGIVTPPLETLIPENIFSAGDKVCFFYFNDGTGRVICKL